MKRISVLFLTLKVFILKKKDVKKLIRQTQPQKTETSPFVELIRFDVP